jgi:hypothetical protein
MDSYSLMPRQFTIPGAHDRALEAIELTRTPYPAALGALAERRQRAGVEECSERFLEVARIQSQ